MSSRASVCPPPFLLSLTSETERCQPPFLCSLPRNEPQKRMICCVFLDLMPEYSGFLMSWRGSGSPVRGISCVKRWAVSSHKDGKYNTLGNLKWHFKAARRKPDIVSLRVMMDCCRISASGCSSVKAVLGGDPTCGCWTVSSGCSQCM